ncbi:MAG: hypothetical protein QX189_08400 [Methylococcales bacterium]
MTNRRFRTLPHLLLDTVRDKNTFQTIIETVKHDYKIGEGLLDEALFNLTCARIYVFLNKLSEVEKILQ